MRTMSDPKNGQALLAQKSVARVPVLTDAKAFNPKEWERQSTRLRGWQEDRRPLTGLKPGIRIDAAC